MNAENLHYKEGNIVLGQGCSMSEKSMYMYLSCTVKQVLSTGCFSFHYGKKCPGVLLTPIHGFASKCKWPFLAMVGDSSGMQKYTYIFCI